MNRFILIALSTMIFTGCATHDEKLDTFFEAAEACSQVCATHPEIASVNSSVGGGFPVLFMGKIETSCACER